MGPYPLGTVVTLFFTFFDEDAPADPTSVTFTVEQPDDTIETFVFGTDAEVTNPSTGYYECAYLGPIAGTYHYKVAGTGDVKAVSETYSFELLADAITGAEPLAFGPCEPWIDPQDVAECCGVDGVGTDTSLFAASARAATDILYPLAAHRFQGICSRTVRAGLDWPCGIQVLSRGHLVGWEGASLPSRKILLPNYPVIEVTQVKIDGDVLASTEYRLDGNQWLTRMADADGNRQTWPSFGRDDLEDTEEGTFSIRYRFGQNVPSAGVMAASQLACEVYKACDQSGQVNQCRLPSGTVRITTNGVTVDLAKFRTWAWTRREGWKTGLPLVDAFLSAVNPNGLQRPPLIIDPAENLPHEVGVVG